MVLLLAVQFPDFRWMALALTMRLGHLFLLQFCLLDSIDG